ncbi:MAG: hypothetical protein DRJ38_07925 [Thermoprotei archaeon]|nr:MAG: hypothetical protein DRJ38_07925 [Thermoprotei archaeon]
MTSKKKELSTVAWLIEALDGYRVGRTVNPKTVMEKIGEVEHVLEPRAKHAKKVIRKTLDYVANLPARDPSAKRWATVYLLVRLSLRITFVLFLFSLFLTTMNPELGFYLLYVATALLYISMIVRWYSLNKVLDFYALNHHLMEGASRRLKNYVQQLIDYMKSSIVREGLKKSKYKLHLFNTDYESIVVLKKPGILREYYLCEINLKS